MNWLNKLNTIGASRLDEKTDYDNKITEIECKIGGNTDIDTTADIATTAGVECKNQTLMIM